MAKKEKIVEKETLNKLKELITDRGIIVSGNGIIIEELNKVNATLEKIRDLCDKQQKFLYFMEKRQQSIENLLKLISER